MKPTTKSVSELEKAENALKNERNLSQVTFYEGYIKGLKFGISEFSSLLDKAEKEVKALKYTEDQGIDAEMESSNGAVDTVLQILSNLRKEIK